MKAELPIIGYAGFFRFVVKDEHGNVIKETPWQKNLITDGGLDLLGTSDNVMKYLHLSSDNTEPTEQDTQVNNAERVATGSRQEMNYKYTPGKPYYTESIYKYTFEPEHVARAYNIAKVCLSTSNSPSSQIFSTALVKDSQKRPTVISIREKETLDVYYAVRQYFDLQQKTSQMTLTVDRDAGETQEVFDIKVLPYRVGNARVINTDRDNRHSWGNCTPESISQIIPHIFNNYDAYYNFAVSDKEIPSDVTSIISSLAGATGTFYKPEQHSIENKSYESGYKKQFSVKLWRHYGNYENGIRSVVVVTTRGVWAVEYTSKTDGKGIKKTSYDELTLNFELSWGRYDGELE